MEGNVGPGQTGPGFVTAKLLLASLLFWSCQVFALTLPDRVDALCLPDDQPMLPGQLLQDEQVAWQSLPTGSLYHGFSSDTCWVRFTLPAPQQPDREWWLLLNDPMLADVTVYLQEPERPLLIFAAGVDTPASEWPVASLNPAFPLSWQGNQPTRVLIRARSPFGLNLPLSVAPAADVRQQDRVMTLLQAGFVGAILIMFCWHAMLYLALRETAHLMYIGWLAVASLFALTLNGVIQHYFWPHSSLPGGYGMLLILPLMIILPARFTSLFLQLATRAPKADQWLTKMALTGAGLLMLAPFLSRDLVIPLMALATLVMVTSAAVISWQRLRQQDPEARAFLMGWSVLMLGGLFMGLGRFGILPPNPVSEHLFQLGLLIQVSLLALIMAAHIRGLDQAREQAEAATREADSLRQHAINEARSRFLATVSHQFRSPMNAVLGMSELLRRNKELGQQSRQQADTIHEAARSLMATLNDLLDFSSIQAGKVRLETQDTGLDLILSEVIELFSAALQRKHLELFCFVESRIPARLVTDPERLKQILINLLSNAIKHSQDGRIVVRFSLRKRAEDGQLTLLCEISDEGTGLDQTTLTQVRNGTFREASGGMGLEVSQQLIKLLGGELEIESGTGKGCHVSFTFQCGTGHAPGQTLPPSPVLVVAADRDLRLSVGQQLQFWGLNARDCKPEDAESAIAAGEPADALILDEAAWLTLQVEEDHRFTDTPWIILQRPGSNRPLPRDTSNRIALPLPLRPTQLHQALATLLPGARADNTPARPAGAADRQAAAAVLVVDDDEVSQMVISSLLNSLDVRVTVTGSGAEAVDLIRARPDHWQVIFMDMQMPGMDGCETTRAIRDLEKGHARAKSWIAILTAHTDDETMQRAERCGADDFLAKPVSRQQLEQALERAMLTQADRH